MGKKLWAKLSSALNLQRAKRARGLVQNVSRRGAFNKEGLIAALCPAGGEEDGVGRDDLPSSEERPERSELRWPHWAGRGGQRRCPLFCLGGAVSR